MAELPHEGAANPWDLDAVLFLAEPLPGEATPAAKLVDRVSEALRWESTASDKREALLPELLSAAHVWAREPCVGSRYHFRLSLACVRGGHCWAAQAPGMPVYLLRDEALQPLEGDVHRHARGEEAHLEPEIVSGPLQDGDALLLCSQSLHEALSDQEVRDVLVNAPSPEVAARKLVALARRRGAPSPAAAVLFAGVGPAVAYRLRSPLQASRPPGTLTPPDPKRRAPVALVAGLTAAAGAVLGAGIGIWISLTLARGTEPAPVTTTPLETTHSVIAPLAPTSTPGAVQSPPGMVPTPPRPLMALPREPSLSTPGGNLPSGPAIPQGPISGAPGPSAAASAPLPAPAATAAGAEPVSLQQPPRHTLAPGLGQGVHLTLQIDPSRGVLGMRADQGALYSSTFPQGVPVGETLTLPLPAFEKGRPPAEEAELRFYSGGQAATSLQGETLKRLLAGEPVGIPGLRPADYDLCWGSPRSATATPPFLSLRIGGL